MCIPAEVEAVLNDHPAVFRSAVIGQPRNGTEDIIAFVQLGEGSKANTVNLANHAASHLASYKQPTEIVIVPEMPMSANGKILKAELSALYPPTKLSAVA